MSTGFIYSHQCLKHLTGPDHPESPDRLKSILQRLRSTGLIDTLKVFSPAREAMGVVSLVHPIDYQNRFKYAVDQNHPYFDQTDNQISPKSYLAARLAARSVALGVDLILEKTCSNVMSAVRPPGHHAGQDYAMGFCFFNNAAIAARYAQTKWQLERIAILDFDVHHGNGTQHIFEADQSILYISLHGSAVYPGTGFEDEIGVGAGRGFTVNFPLPVKSEDAVYLDLIRGPIADKVLSFRPEMIILSAGFDAHELDPLGGMLVTTAGFIEMTRVFRKLAETACNGRLLSVLEGGYNLDALAESVHGHLTVLSEEQG